MNFIHSMWKWALVLVVVVASGCMSQHAPPSASALPPSELRAMQTRQYDAMDPKTAMKTVIDVLQDDGFIVDYGNTELGILHAVKIGDLGAESHFPADVQHSITEPYNRFQLGPARYEATVNVTEFGTRTRIRVGLQRYIPVEYAETGPGIPIIRPYSAAVVDPKTYQEFFAKLDRGIFLQKQGL